MRYRLVLGLLLLLPFLALGAAAPASADNDGYRYGSGYPGGYSNGGYPYYGGHSDYGGSSYGQNYGWGGDGLPGGNWRYSCRNIYVRGDKLFAECRDFGGGWERTGITYTACRGGMMNRGGSLECSRGGYYASSYDRAPDGSFRASCRNIQVQGEKLYAECRDFGGGWERTGITYTSCQGDIANRGGELVCRAWSGAW